MTWVILGGIVVGAGLGAATSAATGGDPGKGALFGAIGGGLTGGIGSLAGSAMGSAAGSAAGGAEGAFGGIGEAALTPAVNQSLSASNVLGSGSLLASAPAEVGTNLTANMGTQFTQGIGSGISNAGTSTASGLVGALPSAAMDVVKASAPEMIKGVAGSVMAPGYSGPSVTDMNVKDYIESRDATNLGTQTWGPSSKPGLGSKGAGLAGGGEVNLEDGQFILPADVVSALGNGSTKAGAQFLDEFFGLA